MFEGTVFVKGRKKEEEKAAKLPDLVVFKNKKSNREYGSYYHSIGKKKVLIDIVF